MRKFSRSVWIMSLVVLCGFLVLGWLLWPQPDKLGLQPPNPALHFPGAAFAKLGDGPVFYDAPAREMLRKARPDLLTPADRESAAGAGEMEAALEDPKLWRKLDRQRRFQTVFLIDDPAADRPLIAHLRESSDWHLAWLDHTSIVFTRKSGAAWESAALEELRRQFQTEPVADRVAFLVQAANRLLAVGLASPAQNYLEAAVKLDPRSPAAWTALAVLFTQQTQWATALDKADRALAAQSDYAPALEAKAQILFSMGKFREAYATSSRLVELLPDRPTALFLHARIAHEARAFGAEIRALRYLIDLAREGGKPLTGYLIYLGQAYASDRQAAPAVKYFEEALGTGDVTPEQRQFLEEAITRIKSRVPMP